MSGAPLVSHAVAFGRALRAQGVPVTSGQIGRFIQALSAIGVADRALARHAARAALASARTEAEAVERLFDRFFIGGGAGDSPAPAVQAVRPQAVPAEVALARRFNQGSSEDAAEMVDRAMTWSRQERLRRKRFDELTADETEALLTLMARTPAPWPMRATRRFRPAARGRAVDWRGTIRDLVRLGELPFEPRRLRRKHKPRPLIVLADVSGSMERYSRLLLHYLHGLVRQSQRGTRPRALEVFAFGTRLTRLTRALRQRSTGAVLDEVSRQVVDWSGGTRIGDALHAFNRAWAPRLLHHGALVAIVSDGWDRGDPQRVAGEMARLRRRASGVFWLNPLVGTQGYAPETAALVAALPFVDALLDAGSLESLHRAMNVQSG